MNHLFDKIHYIFAPLLAVTLFLTVQTCCSSSLNKKFKNSSFRPIDGQSWHDYGIVLWKTPIRVSMDMGSEIYYSKSILDAVLIWNELAGCKIFELVDHSDADIYIELAEKPIVYGPVVEEAKKWVASQKYLFRNKKWISRIEIYYKRMPVDHRYYAMQVAMHELGHSIGLKHSTNELSLMYKKAWGYEKYVEFPIVNDVRNLYCKDKENEL